MEQNKEEQNKAEQHELEQHALEQNAVEQNVLEKNAAEQNEQPQGVGFHKLVLQALPEMWGYQIIMSMIMAIPATVFLRLMNNLASTKNGAWTSANLSYALNWRFPIVLLLGIVLIFLYVVIEIFSQIQFMDDILKGQSSYILKRIWSGLKNFRQFASWQGILVLLFIFLAVPLCGMGFSISLSRTFQVPNFIMDVVVKTPLYLLVYVLLILGFAYIAFTSMFMIHAMVIDRLTVQKARRKSKDMVRKHWKAVVWNLLQTILFIGVISMVAEWMFLILPEMWLKELGKGLPSNYVIDIFARNGTLDFSELEWSIVSFRFLSALLVLMGTYILSVVALLGGSYFMLRFTAMYYQFGAGLPKRFRARPKRSRYFFKVIMSVVVLVLTIFGSFLIGLFYNQIFYREQPVNIIAHRAGGFAAVENSLEGLQIAIDNGVFGSEVDVQATKDGKYVMQHDNTFKRLAGVNKAAKDMTLEEIQKLTLKDANASGKEAKVTTPLDMLRISKGRIKLFLELKGNVNQAMADEMIAMVEAEHAIQDVVVISLNYKIIDYIEKTYPHIDTGLLFFAGLGDVTKLNCDMLIMEEAMASYERVAAVQEAGKEAIVWTVNTEESMREFLDSDVDAVITDDIYLAKRVQKELDERTDLQVIREELGGIWEY